VSQRLRLACLISGSGRTLLNIADRIDDGSLNASIELVIASRSDCAGVQRSRARGLNTLVVARKDFTSETAMHDAISKQINERAIDLICLCGYLRHIRVDENFRGRVINIHPALLPDFGGRGMHGDAVHRAVLAAKKSISGCSIHFVDDVYDHGPIILQRTCPVLPSDDERTLAARVFEQECIAYPEAIRLFSEGRLRVLDGRVIIDPPRGS
jgi:formyltetrahydrofolate-dependent phosphoribosylglycinamide formyltransferase